MKNYLTLCLSFSLLLFVGCRKEMDVSSSGLEQRTAGVSKDIITNLWDPDTFELAVGFNLLSTTQNVEKLIVPFHPTPDERRLVLDSYFSSKQTFHDSLREKLGIDRYADFVRTTYPGRFYVGEITRIYGLDVSTPDEVFKLLEKVREASDVNLPERSNEFGWRIRELFPNVPKHIVINLEALTFHSLVPGTLESVYHDN